MKENTVLIGGGLGNNLFQLSAAIYKFGRGKTNLENLIPKDENSLTKHKFNGETIEINILRKKILVQKLLNWSLRASSKELRSVVLQLQILLVKTMLFILLRKKVFVSDGIGFTSKLGQAECDILVGYFQTYKYAMKNEVFGFLNSIEIQQQTEVLSNLTIEAISKKPIIIHVRRGDYVNSGFGLIGKEYYHSAIKHLLPSEDKEIWIFSDEQNFYSISDLFPPSYKYKFFPPDQLGETETFHLMRHGSAYVIANSSFSWWSAFLRHNQDAVVIAPRKWFLDSTQPKDLFPPNWLLVESSFERENKTS